MKRMTCSLLAAAAFLAGGVAYAQTGVPRTISYQGVLRNADSLIEVADGPYNIIIRLYTVASGGTAVWGEKHTVQVTNGLFSALLGTGTVLTPPGTTLASLNFHEQYWLGVAIGGDPQNDPELTPRVKLTSSPYALNADTVDKEQLSNIITRTDSQAGNTGYDKQTLDASFNFTGTTDGKVDWANKATWADVVDSFHIGRSGTVGIMVRDDYALGTGSANTIKVDHAMYADDANTVDTFHVGRSGTTGIMVRNDYALGTGSANTIKSDHAMYADDANTVDTFHVGRSGTVGIMVRDDYALGTGSANTIKVDHAMYADDAHTVDTKHVADLLLKATYDTDSDNVVDSAEGVAFSTGYMLNVGTVKFDGDGTAALPRLTWTADADTGLYRIGADSVGVTTAGTLRLAVDAIGEVGIGVADPLVNLHVKNAADAALWLEADTDNATESDNCYIYMTQDGQQIGGWVGFLAADGKAPDWTTDYVGTLANGILIGTFDSTVNTPLQLGTAGSVRMTILDGGNVGIGLTNPSQLLDVEGTTRSNDLILDNNGTTAVPAIRWNGDGDTGIWHPADGQLTLATNNVDRLAITASQIQNGMAGSAGVPSYSWTADPDTGMYRYGDNQLAFSTNGAWSLCIDASGNVGIGDSSPSAKLQVHGGIYLASAFTPDSLYYNNNAYISVADPGVSEDFIGYKANTFYFKDSVGGSDATDPNVVVGGSLTAATVNTGQGAYELYAMNQNIQTTDSVTFNRATLTDMRIGTAGASTSKISINVGTTATNLLNFTEDGTDCFYFQSDFAGAGATGNSVNLKTFWGATAMSWRGDGQVTMSEGTAATPALGIAGDTDTGIYHPVANTIGFTTAGVERVRIGGAGFPLLLTGVQSTATSDWIKLLDYTGAVAWHINDRSGTGLNFTETGVQDHRLFLKKGGNVGIGTDTPVNRLDVEGGAVIGATYSGSIASPANGLMVEGYVGVNTNTADAQLHVKRSVAGSGAVPSNHVAIIENTSTTDGADVLCLRLSGRNNPTTASGWISFLDSDSSCAYIQGNGAGGAVFTGTSGDYAEWLPRVDEDELIAAGDVVGVFGGMISKTTAKADIVMVVSTSPNVIGSAPVRDEQKMATGNAVAFVGQALVRVCGPVAVGDYVVASGLGDGTAIAVAPAEMTAELLPLVIGRAWEASADEGLKKIKTVIGLDVNAELMAQMAVRIQAAEAENAALKTRLDAFEKRLAALEKK